MSDRGAPGPISRGYAWALLAVHPAIPVAWIALVVLATLTLPALGSAGSAPLEDLVAKDSPALAAQARSAALFGSPLATDTVVVQRNPRGLTGAERAAFGAGVRAVAERRAGRDLAGLRAVVPVLNVPAGPVRWRERGTTAVGYLVFDPRLNLEDRRALAERYVHRYLRPAPGARAGITGAAPGRLAQYDAISGALGLITVGSVLLIGLIVGLHFRSVVAPLVTLAVAGIAYGLSVRVLGWAGERVGLSLPREVEPVLVVLLLGLVTDYAVFFLSAFRDALAREDGRFAAMRAATAGTARVVLTAGLIVVAGTAALVVGRLDFFRAFGPGLALTALIAMAVCLTFIPACLALLGPRMLGGAAATPRTPPPPRLPAHGLLATPRIALRTAERIARAEGMSRGRVIAARIVSSRPVAVPIVLVCIAALLFGASGLRRIDLSVSLVPSLPRGDPVRVAGEDAARGFAPGIAAPVELLVEAPGVGTRRAALGRLEGALRRVPGITAVAGPAEQAAWLGALGTTRSGGAALGGELTVTRDGGAARIAVVLDEEPGSASAIDVVGRLGDRLPALLPDVGLGGARASIGGETALGGDTVDAVVGDLGRIAAVALALNLLALVVFMRALVAPLYLLAASVLGFAAALGLTVYVFQGLLGHDGLTYYVPLATAVLLVSLGSDYNVFVAGRIWAQARTRRLREAVAVAVPQAAGAVTVAGITLAACFALLVLVPLRSFREFALLMVIGVLIDALLVRSLLIPGLVSLFGEASWWPGRRIDPPRHDELIAAVARRAGVEAVEANRAAQATLATLSERLSRSEARTLGAQLPAAFRSVLTERRAERFGLDEFAARVAERSGTDAAGALKYARAVVATLDDVIDETTMAYVRGRLGEEYARLFGEVPERGRDEVPL